MTSNWMNSHRCRDLLVSIIIISATIVVVGAVVTVVDDSHVDIVVVSGGMCSHTFSFIFLI